MNRRLITNIIVLLCIVALPYWVYFPILIIALIVLPFYWEGILFAFLIDVLYGNNVHQELSFVFPLAIYTSVFVLILIPLRERIRLNA